MKIFAKALLSGFIIAMIFSMVGFSAVCDDLREDVLRVHILANSDSEEDQELKIKVRDKFLAYTSQYLISAENKNDAIKIVLNNKDNICDMLEQFIRENEYSYNVDLICTNMYFETRSYENGKLPAGYYDAIRIIIGEGKGKNWWCVMFPQLCLPAVQYNSYSNNTLTEAETEVVECEVEYKFKIIEWFCSAGEWVKNLF